MSVPQTLYITGISRPATENPISQRHRVLFLAFLVDAKTGTILEVEVNALCQITSSFLSQLLVGYSFSTQVEEMLHQGRGPLLGPLPQIDLSRHQAGSHQMDKLEFRASFSPFITLVLSLRSRPQRA